MEVKTRPLLTISTICKEALVILAQLRKLPEPPTPIAFPKLLTPSRPKAFFSAVALPETALSSNFDDFTKTYILPPMIDLVEQAAGKELGSEGLPLPVAVYAASREVYNGVCLRTLIIEDWPVGDDWPFAKDVRRYYDVNLDEFVTGPTVTALHFTVHEPGVSNLWQLPA